MSAAEEVMRDQDAASLRHVDLLSKLARQVRGDEDQATVVSVTDTTRHAIGARNCEPRPARVSDAVVIATARRIWPRGFSARQRMVVETVLHAAAAEGFEFVWIDVTAEPERAS